MLQVSITDAGVQLLDASGNTLAAVSATDTEASNGVVHTIGAVMLPPSTPAPPMNIVEIAESVETFSTLVAALTAADLVETLSGPGPFTVFAPTNAAFGALAPGTLDSLLLEENKDQLTGILTFHVVSGQLMAADLSDGQTLTTVNGAMLQVSITDAGVQLLDASGNTLAAVSATDTEASNGVVHTIGAVMLPPSTPAPPMNIVEIAESVDIFSTLVAALTAADLVETLSGPGPFTVFAPTNA